MVRLQYAFQYMRSNRGVKSADWHGDLPTELKYKLERIMIKEYGNVRKCTKKNTGRTPHIKVYRDGVKLLSDTPFLMSNFVRFQIFLRLPFRRFAKKSRLMKC